jgi:hypothetical protein
MAGSGSLTLRGRMKAVLLAPLRVLGGLVFIALVVVIHPFIRERERRKKGRVLRALELDLGTVLETSFQGGALTTSVLTVTCLRPGPWPDVVGSLEASLRAKGYPEAGIFRQLDGRPRNLAFGRQVTRGRVEGPPLAVVGVHVYAEGEYLEQLQRTVPPGHTALVISI